MNSGELLVIFRDEAEERIDRMVTTLLAVEQGSPPADSVAALFREAHSIKGGAGMMGLEDVYGIANALEDRLAEARDVGRLDPSLVEPLLQSVDDLRVAVSAATGVPPEITIPPAAESSSPATPVVVVDDGAPGAAALPVPVTPDREQRSIRVEPGKVDRLLDAVGETVLQHRRLEHAVEGTEGAPENLLDRGDVLLAELQDAVIGLRTLPLSAFTGAFPRAVRDLAQAEGKQVELAIEGADTQLDRAILEGAAETIGHLLRNAVGHGVEAPEDRRRAGKPTTARVTLRAEQRGGRVAIEVTDDGRGVAPELLELARDGRSLVDVLAEPGLSTAQNVTELSGRGVGLDAVRSAVAAVGGDLEVVSEPGRSTTVTLLLPVSLVLLHVLLVERSGVPFGIPISAVAEVVVVDEPMSLGGRSSIDVRGEAVPFLDPVTALGGGTAAAAPGHLRGVVVAAGGRRAALGCDQVSAGEEVLVKPLGPLLAGVPGYLGAAIMRDGRIALIPDPAHLVSMAPRAAAGHHAERPPAVQAAPTVLVVDDQFTVRELQRSILEASGYRVRIARDGREAWDLLSDGEPVDVVVTDIEMPEMDGLELLESIRRGPEHASLPVVVITSRAREEDERRGFEAGADAYIVKERFDQRVLLDTVGRLVSR